MVNAAQPPCTAGNARWEGNDITACPWSAYDVPVPNTSTVLVLELLENLGIAQSTGHDSIFLAPS